METLESLYGIKSNSIELSRVKTKSGRWLETFEAPSRDFTVKIDFPEFTCLCPRTGHPDFATFILEYTPSGRCIELKSLKYYLNSFRDEGHFHEEITNLIADELQEAIDPKFLTLTGSFNVRGGTYPTITATRIKNPFDFSL